MKKTLDEWREAKAAKKRKGMNIDGLKPEDFTPLPVDVFGKMLARL